MTLEQKRSLRHLFFRQNSGSIVLGLNDALVELMGVLSGLTLTLEHSRIIGIASFITGISAALSMAASEYLSSRAEGKSRPIFAGCITGITYIITVILLVLPYFFLEKAFLALGFSLMIALLIIFLFTYAFSREHHLSFRKRFFQMAFLSLSVAGMSFMIGLLINTFLLTSSPEVRDQGKTDQNQNVFCTAEVIECPDGTYVGRVPPTCDFASCE